MGLEVCSMTSSAVLQSALSETLPIAFAVVLVRLVAIFCGSWFGCYCSATSVDVRRLFWMTMVTQVRKNLNPKPLT
jgi:hypothetical protein